MPKYIYHITCNTGHTRRCYRDEVDDGVLFYMRRLINECLSSGDLLPIPKLDGYCLSGAKQGKCAGFSVISDGLPIAYIAVGGHSLCASKIWVAMHDQFPFVDLLTTKDNPPQAPWCAAIIFPTRDIDVMHWLGDFERTLAWGFLERNEKQANDW